MMTNGKQVFNSLNANERPKNYKKFTLPSQTIPDQTLSLKTILEKHSRGIDIGGSLDPIYDEDETNQGINPKTLDLTDWQEMARENKEVINDYNNNKEKAEKRKQQAEKEKQKEALKLELLQELKNSTNNP